MTDAFLAFWIVFRLCYDRTLHICGSLYLVLCKSVISWSSERNRTIALAVCVRSRSEDGCKEQQARVTTTTTTTTTTIYSFIFHSGRH